MVTPPIRGQRWEEGAALIAALWISALVAAVALAAWTVADARLGAARRRMDRARAASLADACLHTAAAWFEEEERSGLVAPPRREEVDREQREVDPDGDGEGPHHSAASVPWNVRYKETAGDEDLFRPPDGPSPADRFVGTAAGPDLVLRAGGSGEAVLARMLRALDAPQGAHVERLAFFAPPRGGREGELATIEVIVSWPTAGGLPTRLRARAEVKRIDYGRLDRPLEVEGDAHFLGDARWSHGEAFIDADLFASAATRDGWPGGIPWKALDRPLHDDEDGDLVDDDADGDGIPDLEAFRASPGSVPDPWWRGRVGGRWHGVTTPAASCTAPFPFGPRATPPAPPEKESDRSGLFVSCPAPMPPALIPAWRELARLGIRGAGIAIEEERGPGRFRIDGEGEGRGLEDLPPGALWWLEPAASRRVPLVLPAGGWRGAWCVATGDAELAIDGGTARALAAPGDPRDTRGESRAGGARDDHLVLRRDIDGWQIGRWKAPEDAPHPESWHPSGVGEVAFEGIVAVSGRLRVHGSGTLLGQARSGSLVVDGTRGATVLSAAPFSHDDPRTRPGPPGAPRIVLRARRTVPGG